MVPAPPVQPQLCTVVPRRLARPWRRQEPLQPPRLSVIIVNYCQWSQTVALVRRLRAEPAVRSGAAEIVVVDNHSPAHPAAARLRRTPGVSLRRWGRNRGFARAVNEGCRLSQGDWFLLLNPDTTPPDGFLEEVLAVLERHAGSRAGVIGLGLRNEDGSRQLSTGAFPTFLGTLTGLLRPRARRKYRPLSGRRRVPWVTGCCLLVRRDCWQQLGGLDADFFLYYEDVDFCRRARARGWSVWYEPGPHVIHHQPLHTRRVPPHLRLVVRHALLTYAAKHWPDWQVHALAGIVRAEAWLRGLTARLRGETAAARAFAELGPLAADLAAGRRAQARRRLDQTLRREERRLGA